ncbi:MAG: lipopolysaccharide heptosyltransferase II [Gammaproteobacteria bacterium]|nr:MAG: lipopolysaccharide heptosyltransferase II [Gammaproteobacteria bacterium]
MHEAGEKVLIVGPSWVGDMVMSQVLYIYLQQTRPGLVIDVLAPTWSAPILARMPQVNSAIAMPLGHGELQLGRRRRLGHELRGHHYDQVILLPNSLKSALIPFFARIPRRTGWRGEMRYGLLNDLRILDEAALPLMVQRFVALGMARGATVPGQLPEPHLLVDSQEAQRCRDVVGLSGDLPILALCPGAEFGSAKRWPAQYYAELARDYLARGWQVALYGSANDREVCAHIKGASGDHPHCHNLAGATSLAEVVDLLSLSAAVISNDSGLMHIAAALQRPLLAIYGATSPDFTPPLSVASALLVSAIDCAPCFQRECPLGHHRCMRDTTPQQAAAKLETLLADSEGRS